MLAALAVVGLLLLIDVLSGPGIRIGGLMVGVPAVCAVFLSPVRVLVVAGVTLASVVVAARDNGQLGTANFPVALTAVVLISATSVAAAAVRQRRERELAQSRWVAATTQRTLLKPLPERVGPVNLRSMYLAADKESAVGGDVYAAVRTVDGGARILVGDAEGKGLSAVELGSSLVRAFLRATRTGVPLEQLPGWLDGSLREDITDIALAAPVPAGRAAPTPPLEGFVTAVAAEVSQDGAALRILDLGHPPPLLLRHGEVITLDRQEPALPLGLGDLAEDTHTVGAYRMEIGDILLLYTDGVIEARNAAGEFYPLAERLRRWPSCTCDDLLTAITEDLARHVAAPRGDDVAMVTVQRTV
ncbi:PP2C family protein-serine/threonine phosphatase [Actinacidiphila bryophytorum]|uniref:Stage II sporulation protein E (SpoIIE) n=1 Tax=Actinacidiphila bryophytorum TaxID=1436133 RepID=A0A9W4E2F2_9ACTN|nr:PP2C family protein-serine/threonine phosphatase [Actinacidiphila bryophytorum]MBM9435337.1 serine/threonine-protein phosphatase [Actinacidiphila bryophytorum]MBN6542176.1 serine/threonine-protein phosphatase [Actinacidiphila bryophytorum]CAG7606964.1 Stage II sporulation protein E (SpoIIE) [Actinacidiphila bryophytorum]